jgi:hypothetical protein
MALFKKKKSRRIDLLEMSESERIKLILEVKESLKQKAVEAKLWQSFMQADDLTINGEQVQREDVQLKGLSIEDLLRGNQQ